MTRTYAAKRLLEHGELTFKQFREITGWTCHQAWGALACLIRAELVVAFHDRGVNARIYRLVA